MLYRVGEFVNISILKSIQHAFFWLSFNYPNAVWGQNKNSSNWLLMIKKKFLRIISFECSSAHSNPLFYKNEISNFHDKIIMENCLFISKYVNFHLLSILNHWFTFSSDSHTNETSCSSKFF